MEARQQIEPQRRGLCAHVGDFLRWLLFLVLITSAVASFIMYFVHSRLDDEIRRYVETKFQTNYPDLVVQVRSAHRVKGSGIEIRGLLIAEPRSDGEPLPVVYVEELFAECASDLGDLAAGNTHARRLVLRGMKLQATRLPDGSWSIDRLLPLPKFGNTPPPITIENSYLELVDLAGTTPRVTMLRDISLTSHPVVSQTSAPTISPPPFRLQGSFTSEYLRRVQVRGYIDLAAGEWDVSGTVEGLDVSSRTIDALPQEIAKHLTELRSATGTAAFSFAITKPPGDAPLAYSSAGDFNGRIEDARLPQSLVNVHVPFEVDQRGLRVQDAVAQAGATSLQLSATLTELQHGSPFAVRLKAERVKLDEHLEQVLPRQWREQWGKFSPRGTINADLTVRFDGQHTETSVVADVLDASFAYHKFPYRVHRAAGRIAFVDNVLEISNLRASANGHPVLIKGKLNNPGPDATGWMDVTVQEPMPLDDQLIDALQGKQEEIVRSLTPTGMVRIASRFERLDSTRPPHKRLRIELLNCSMRFHRFPYPLYNITGLLTMDNGEWTFQELEGYNDSGFVTCSGGWKPDERGNSILTMDFNATDVPLEDELRDALSPGARRFWQTLHPRGTIDHLAVGLRYDATLHDLSISIYANKRGAAGNVEGRSITVKPSWLPYQLDEVTGVASYRNGSIQFEHIKGFHGKTSIEVSGTFQNRSDDRWRLRVSDLYVDRLHTNHEVVSALPKRLGDAVAKLNLQGPVNISGTLGIDGVVGVDQPVSSEWSLDFDVEDVIVNCAILLEHLRGQIHLAGSNGPTGHYSRGQINLDSLVYHGIQLTQIAGPFSIDDQHLSFGDETRRLRGEQTGHPVRATVFDGVLVGSGRVWLNEAVWRADAELFDADLANISKELAPGSKDLSGRTFGTVRLTGTSTGRHNLRGTGSVQLRKADIYTLPVMARLLKLVKVRPPDETAFTSSDIDFRIEADRIYFDRIDFDGDAINLSGHGEMALDRTIDLTFETSVVERNSVIDRMLRPIIRESGGLFEVYVRGTLDDPQIERRVNQAIQQVLPEGPPGGMSRLPTPRGRANIRARR